MQRDDRLSVSGCATARAWRLSSKATSPSSEQPDPVPPKSDLGSDEDWHPAMASASDVGSDAPNSPLQPSRSSSPDTPPAGDDLGIQWNDDDMEHFVEDIKHATIPTQPPAPSFVPNPASFTQVSSAEPMAMAYDAEQQVQDEYDAEEVDQLSIIPHFRGVSSREAVSKDAKSNGPQNVSKRLAGWADRPRPAQTTPAGVASTTGHAADGTSEHHNSVGVTTGLANRVGSDSGLSSHEGSLGSGTAFQISTRTSSEDSDMSRKGGGGKTVSFVTQGMDDSRSAFVGNHVRDSHERISPSNSFDASSGPNSTRSSDSLTAAERKVSGLRLSLRESKVRLSAARLTKSKRHQKRNALSGSNNVGQNATTSSAQGLSSDMSGIDHGTLRDSFRNGLRPSLRGAGSSARGGGHRPQSTQSDGMSSYPRQESGLSQNGATSERPLSTPQQSLRAISNQSRTTSSGVFFERAPAVTIPASKNSRSNAKALEMKLKPQSKDFSFLECVIEVLKGATVLKRKNVFQATEAIIWLTSDMQAVKYKVCKKGCAPVTYTLRLMRVRKLKGADREITLEMMDEKKPLDFIFQSRDRADVWLSGLCCLVPTHATVKSRNRKWDNRVVYDPLLDSWNGKPLSSRKRLNEFILLGSIGRGSFGKVKVALSSVDRQFYAVKVLSKAMMRKRIRNVPFEKATQDGLSSQLTVSDVNEIKVMKNLDHENVMKMKGVFDDVEDDRLYIVLEYIAKGPIMSSSKLTGAKPMTEDEARDAFVDVLSGLEYLHHKRVAHRDIKPDNLLEAGDGTVKISDFGAAVLYDGEELSEVEEYRSHNSTVGTPAFTAPELCMSDKSPPCTRQCYAADVWSLGATLFYMVYGRAPFIARSVFEMYDAICTQDLVFPDYPAVSKNLQDLIQKMLIKSPEARASIASVIQSPWLTESLDVAEKLAELRKAIRRHATEREHEEGLYGRRSGSASR